MTHVLGAELPAGWSSARLKDCTSFLNRGTPPNYADDGEVRAISQAVNQRDGLEWNKSRYHSCNGDPSRVRGYLHAGDTLVNSTGTGTLGRVGYFDSSPDDLPCMADGHVTVVRTRPDVLWPRFAYYWLTSAPFQDLISSVLAVGATNQIELSRERLSEAPVPLPPLEEQRRIADFLDAETARISRIVELQRGVSERLRQRQGAWLNNVLIESEAVVSTATATPLGHLVDYRRPVMYGIVLPGPNVDDGVPIVKGGDVAADRLTLDALNRTTREIEAGYARSRLVGGDIVIAIRGSVGETAVVPNELTGANLTQDAARIAARHDVNKIWLRWVLHAPAVAQQIQSRVTGATIKGINIWDLKRVLIPAPPRHVQDRIAAEAVDGVEHARRLISKIDQQIGVLAERRSALITAAVTGQIDVVTAGGVGVA